MKLLLLFNHLNDIIYYHGSSQVISSLISQFLIDHVKQNSAINESDSHISQIDFLVQIFSPLLNTYNVLKNELKSTYRCITLSNNDDIYFRRRDDYTFIGVFNPNAFMEPEKQLSVIDDFIESLLGPCLDLLKTTHKTGFSSLIDSLIYNWSDLYCHELAFLFNGIDRLKVKGEIKAKAVESIDKCFVKAGSLAMDHYLIICGTKLFCLYSGSKAAKLIANDFLLLTVLVRMFYPAEKLEDWNRESVFYESCQENASSHGDSRSSYGDHSHSSFHSCNETHHKHKGQHSPTNNNENNDPVGETKNTLAPPRASFSPRNADLKKISSQNQFFPVAQEIELDKNKSENSKMIQIFLRTASDNPKPYRVHITPLTNNVVFLGLESTECYGIPQLIQVVSKATERISVKLQDSINKSLTLKQLNRLKTLLDKMYAELHSNVKFQKFCRSVVVLTTEIDKIVERLETATENTSIDLSITLLENLVTKVNTTMKTLFETTFLEMPMKINVSVSYTFQQMAQTVGKDLFEYLTFLEVKAQRNLASTSFQNAYPGMFHFALVDRRTDEILTPTPDWENYPDGFPQQLLRTIEWLRTRAHILKSGAINVNTGESVKVKAEQQEIRLCRAESQFQYTYILQWTPAKANQMGDPGLEICAVHYTNISQRQVTDHIDRILTRWITNRQGASMSESLI